MFFCTRDNTDWYRDNSTGELQGFYPSMGVAPASDKAFSVLKGIKSLVNGVRAFPKNSNGISTWNQFQKMTVGQFVSRGDASKAWDLFKKANNITTGTGRSMAQRSMFLKDAATSDKYPSWMNQWLNRGKVPPGYHVDHFKALFDGGIDVPSNMLLKDILTNINIHRCYRP